MAKAKKNVAGIIATETSEGCGLIATWTLGGASDYARLSDAVRASGLDVALVPTPPTADAALTRAVKVAKTATVRIGKHREGGYLISDVVDGPDGLPFLQHRLIATVVGDELRFQGVGAFHADQADAQRIAAEYRATMTELSAQDFSAFLSDLARKHDAVAMKWTGGVYYVPPAKTESWRKWVAAIEASTRHWFGEVPAMKSERAIATILHQLEDETRAAAGDIQVELERTIAGLKGGVGPTALENRLGAVSEMRAKLDRYAQAFGKPAEAAVAAITKLKQNIFLTLQFAEGKADGRDMNAPRLLELDDRQAAPEAEDLENDPAVRRLRLVETDEPTRNERRPVEDDSPARPIDLE